MSMSVDASHAVSAGVITTAVAKAWTTFNGVDVPLMLQVEAGVACGASAIVADSLLKTQPPMVRAGATGGLLAGAMYAWKQDENWPVWVGVGAVSYYLSDWAMKQYAKNAPLMGQNGAGQRQASDVPTVSGY